MVWFYPIRIDCDIERFACAFDNCELELFLAALSPFSNNSKTEKKNKAKKEKISLIEIDLFQDLHIICQDLLCLDY